MLTIISNYKKLFTLTLKSEFNEILDNSGVQDTAKDWTNIDDLVEAILKDKKIDANDKENVEKLVKEMNSDKNDIYAKTKTETKTLMEKSLKDMMINWYTIENEDSYNTIKKLLSKFYIWNYLPEWDKLNIERKEDWVLSLIIETEKNIFTVYKNYFPIWSIVDGKFIKNRSCQDYADFDITSNNNKVDFEEKTIKKLKSIAKVEAAKAAKAEAAKAAKAEAAKAEAAKAEAAKAEVKEKKDAKERAAEKTETKKYTKATNFYKNRVEATKESIKKIQEKVLVNPDWIFWKETFKAICKYQCNNKLVDDWIAWEDTLYKLWLILLSEKDDARDFYKPVDKNEVKSTDELFVDLPGVHITEKETKEYQNSQEKVKDIINIIFDGSAVVNSDSWLIDQWEYFLVQNDYLPLTQDNYELLKKYITEKDNNILSLEQIFEKIKEIPWVKLAVNEWLNEKEKLAYLMQIAWKSETEVINLDNKKKSNFNSSSQIINQIDLSKFNSDYQWEEKSTITIKDWVIYDVPENIDDTLMYKVVMWDKEVVICWDDLNKILASNEKYVSEITEKDKRDLSIDEQKVLAYKLWLSNSDIEELAKNHYSIVWKDSDWSYIIQDTSYVNNDNFMSDDSYINPSNKLITYKYNQTNQNLTNSSWKIIDRKVTNLKESILAIKSLINSQR